MVDDESWITCMMHLYGRDYDKEMYNIKILDEYFTVETIDYINVSTKPCIPIKTNVNAILHYKTMKILQVLIQGG